MGQVKNTKAALKLHDVVVNNIEFKREERKIDGDKEIKISFDSSIYEVHTDSLYKVTIKSNINNEPDSDFYLNVEMVGYFTYNEELKLSSEVKERVIQKNTLAILFPYLRSLITTLSANVGIKPIILPPVNINALLEQRNKKLSE